MLAESAADLQVAMLTTMTANMKKPGVEIFNGLYCNYTCTYDGHVLDIKDKLIYLKMVFEGRYNDK